MYLGEKINVLAELQKAGGCAGGAVIYGAAKAMAIAINLPRKDRTLWSSTQALMKTYFPKLDLGDVEFNINANLPANWFESPDKTEAMTFGDKIYFKNSGYQGSGPRPEGPHARTGTRRSGPPQRERGGVRVRLRRGISRGWYVLT
jgi:hypothetical protein